MPASDSCENRVKRPAGLPGWTPWALWGGVLLLYLCTATPNLVGADNGEFVILGAQGGRAHPPGYPLYVLYLQAMAWLPAANPAHAAALATAILGATSVAVLYRAARAWGGSEAASLLAVVGLGLSPQFWFLSTHAEAFAPNHLFAALLVWVAAPRGPLCGAGRMLVLGLLAGLGLSNHHSIILLAPVGLYGVYLGFREAARPIGALAASALALGAGLLPYLQLFSAAGHPELFQWGEVSTLGDLIGHFLRRDYGTTTLAPHAGDPQPLLHLVTLVREVSADFAIIGVILGAVGMAAALSKKALFSRLSRHLPSPGSGIQPEKGIAWLAASFFLAGPIFILLFNLEPSGIGLEVIRRFYTLPELLLTIFVALGIDASRPLWEGRTQRLRWGIILATFGLLAAASLVRLDANYRPTLNNYARNTLESLPKGAILVGSGDARYLSVEYMRRVEGLRPDVAFIHPTLLRFDWYAGQVRAELARKYGVSVDISAPMRREKLAEALVETGHPLFWADPPSEQPEGFIIYPQGTASRVLAPGARYPSPEALLAQNAQILAAFEFADPPPFQVNPWGWGLYAEYPRVWFDIAEHCARSEESACQQLALERAEAFND